MSRWRRDDVPGFVCRAHGKRRIRGAESFRDVECKFPARLSGDEARLLGALLTRMVDNPGRVPDKRNRQRAFDASRPFSGWR